MFSHFLQAFSTRRHCRIFLPLHPEIMAGTICGTPPARARLTSAVQVKKTGKHVTVVTAQGPAPDGEQPHSGPGCQKAAFI